MNPFIQKRLLQASMSCSCNFSTSDMSASNCLASSRERRHFIPLKGLIRWKCGNYGMSFFVEDKLDCSLASSGLRLQLSICNRITAKLGTDLISELRNSGYQNTHHHNHELRGALTL